MANEFVIPLDPATESGLTIHVQLYSASALAQTITLSEVPSGSAVYTNTATISGLAAGTYTPRAIRTDTGESVGDGGGEAFIWNGTAETPAAFLPSDRSTLSSVSGEVSNIQAGVFGAPPDNTSVAALAMETLLAVNSLPSARGPGNLLVTLNLKTTTGTPIANAGVWITTDIAGSNVIAGTLPTDSNGNVAFMLNAGNTYYRWAEKSGINFTNPESFVAA